MMRINLFVAVPLMISVALISGLLFSFTIAVSPGLKHLSDFEFLKAMKNINKEILNPIFLFSFFSPLLLFLALIYSHQNRGLLVVAFLAYLLVIAITATINVPLNNQLERIDLFNVNGTGLSEFRNVFESRWTFWNNVRTVLSVISLVLLTLSQLQACNSPR
jgi:uncharacterized membrane protein